MGRRTPWKEIRTKGLSQEVREQLDIEKHQVRLEMTLHDLRSQIGGMTQVEVANLLRITQAAVSKIEGRQDMLLSTLAEYVSVLGGNLELVAHFQDRDVRITQFENVKGQLAGAK